MNRLGRGTLITGAALGIFAHQASSGLDKDNQLSRQFYETALGDPNAVSDALGRDVGPGGLAFANVMFGGANVGAGVAGAAVGAAVPIAAGTAIMSRSKSWKGKLIGAGVMAGSLIGGGAGYQVGKYSPALASGYINDTTVADYNRRNRTKMPTVPGDVVLGMYNTRLA